MERNRWETAIRCLEVAVHPNTGNDEVVAAVNGFRRSSEGIPLSQICIEFSCGGVPLAELARMKATMERLSRENLELRRKLAVEEGAQAGVARRLDDACKRIYELTQEAEAAQRVATAAQQEFEDFRSAYARVIDGVRQNNVDLRWALDEATRDAAEQSARATVRPFRALLAEARLSNDRAAAFVSAGNGSGKRPTDDPWTA